MKKIFLLLLCISLFIAAGCGAKESTQSLFAIDIESAAEEASQEAEAPHLDLYASGVEIALPDSPAEAKPDAAEATDASPVAQLTVTDTAAYIFEGQEGMTLYGAAAYKNTGNCPITVTDATFDFTVNGTNHTFDFLPIMNDVTVVLPGETSFVAFWQADSSLAADSAVSLSAKLGCNQADAGRITVSPSGIYLADNYPGFTTMTGNISADAPCSLNLVYVGFYDEADTFLGVWHFTKNASLEVGETKSFTVHMKELPIEDLAQQTARVRVLGVGF